MVKYQALFERLELDLKSQGFSRPLSEGEKAFCTPRALAASLLRENVFKKFSPEQRCTERQTSRAILDFLENMHRLSEFNGFEPQSSWDETFFGLFRDEIYWFWNVRRKHKFPIPLIDDLRQVWPNLRPGPGASILAEGNDLFTKLFASPLSVTSTKLSHFYRLTIRGHSTWARAEKNRSRCFGRPERSVVLGSRLSTVPKNSETGRCICTEPNINMMFQLGIGEALHSRLKKVYGLDFENQESKNQALARRASIIGHLCTIDLKSASDSVSLALLRQVLPFDFLRLLLETRSNECLIPGVGWRSLPIISTMGNGYTFPLQTMLFSALVSAVYRLHGIQRSPDNFAVYGDDIICETRVYPSVVRYLGMCGFIVNPNKSFSDGYFRESCGADYYRGVNVRSIYIKTLNTRNDIFVAINQLNRWSYRTGIALRSAVSYLLARVPWMPVPRWESDDAGIKVPYACVAKKLVYDRFTQSPLYRYYAPLPYTISARQQSNPDGALVALLSGSIRNGRIARRARYVQYKLKWNSVPNWDYSGDHSEDLSWDLG